MSGVGELARGVIVTGFAGTSDAEELRGFAGYVLFDRNGSSVAAVRPLTDALRRLSDQPPLIGIDQEGGRVARLREGVEPMPSMMALGAIGDPGLAERAGEQVAFDLRRAGCTLDFAPVLDLAIDPRNVVIGTRSLGADPKQVAALGAAFGRGLKTGGVLSCYKHFPGHGATAVDSHAETAVVVADEAMLRDRDLVPFAAIARGAPAMMTGHVLAGAFDAAKPATLSTRIATTLLRADLGFAGVLVSDCLEMKGVGGDGSPELAVEALAAGVDLLLFSHDPQRASAAAQAIERAVGDGRLALQRLEEAYARVGR
ncbi:MAG: beta-N-acetylhexosaminidase, partial [Candidatus Baltobacteraceae bacterium]